jgi:hypothetical protein
MSPGKAHACPGEQLTNFVKDYSRRRWPDSRREAAIDLNRYSRFWIEIILHHRAANKKGKVKIDGTVTFHRIAANKNRERGP